MNETNTQKAEELIECIEYHKEILVKEIISSERLFSTFALLMHLEGAKTLKEEIESEGVGCNILFEKTILCIQGEYTDNWKCSINGSLCPKCKDCQQTLKLLNEVLN